MIKLNKIAHKRLILQAKEAKLRGLNKLAGGILFAISADSTENDLVEEMNEENDLPEDDEFEDEHSEEDISEENQNEEYSYDQLNEEIYQELWKLSSKIAKYYNCERMDADKIGKLIEDFTEEFVEKVEEVLDVENGTIGPYEPKVMGES